jgi:hypothetical protein
MTKAFSFMLASPRNSRRKQHAEIEALAIRSGCAT